MTTEIQKVENTQLARPSYIPQGAEGTEHLRKEDLQLPRLALAQQMSPQLLEGDPKFVTGLKFGDLFNTLTGDVYGKGPISFAVIRADAPRGVEFNPLSEGGGIKDFHVPLTDPRMLFGPNGEKPIATKFYDYILILLPQKEMVALSLKSSALTVAKQLNALMKFRRSPVWTGLYTLTTSVQKNAKGSFAVYQVKNSGWVPENEIPFFQSAFDGVRDKELVVDREPGEDDDADLPEHA